ncbi:3-phosphoshikimate 1-carboxyvinyltransferase [Selenomonas sp. TAMA-11512]|uniref:3-phosphoshikimate 1-carboxyvinyltransferase n=1 Tax=Selenomonas sp. TAMA-11512 TaxID=3095337 RepID=UPI00308C26FF|nr:3-phosphoshikimate 1-carboxyvinyltransferase [Selenomonas sp. TAMA-11512]
METKKIEKMRGALRGEITIPADKSISHRSVLFSALGKGKTHVKNFLEAADCLSSAACMRALGADVERVGEGEYIINGCGLRGLKEPSIVLDAGNSGTTLRLSMGMLAGQPFLTTFMGDASLSRRPMGRVIKPLAQMGANIRGREGDKLLPITILPKHTPLQAIQYDSPVASAQVKSAILLAGLYADGDTTVRELYVSRDHSERMLSAFGAKLKREGSAVTISPAEELVSPEEIIVPGDISSAAFWLVAGSVIEGSDLLLKNVGVNPTRTGILDVLFDMGAKLELLDARVSGGEPVADIHVQAHGLKGVYFGAEIIPRLVDEIPIIAVAALFAEGDTVIEGAGELRVKETDRLSAILTALNALAPGSVEERGDGLIIHGGRPLKHAKVDSYDDHRMAMALSVAGAAGAGADIEKPSCVRISYPSFYEELERLSR